MAKEYVLTLTAANRIGILAAVSNAIAELSGNMRQIDVSVVRNYFTMILSAEFPDHRDPDVIIDHLRDMGRPYGLSILLNDPLDDGAFDSPAEECESYFLTLTGSNQPGAMRMISSKLMQEGVDIANLHAAQEDDGDRFRMTLEISVPIGIDPTSLTIALEALNHDADITAELHTADDFRHAGLEVPLRSRG